MKIKYDQRHMLKVLKSALNYDSLKVEKNNKERPSQLK